MKTINHHQLANAIEAFYLDCPDTESVQSCIDSVVQDIRDRTYKWEYELIDEEEEDVPADVLDEIQAETAVEMNDDDLEGIMGLTHLREID